MLCSPCSPSPVLKRPFSQSVEALLISSLLSFLSSRSVTRPFSSLPGRLGPSPTYRFPSWQSSEYWVFQLDRVQIITGCRLLEHEAVQLVAWSAAYPAQSYAYRFTSWQSSEYWMAQLDWVQNTFKVQIFRASGRSASCLVGCLPRI